MGRIAGVAPEETRTRLLDSAAAVFARLGYDGASIAEITSEAGLSSGSVYAHYASKAELFVATLRSHADREFDRLLGTESDVGAFMIARGEKLDRQTASDRTLLVEAIMAAKRHPEVAAVLRSSMVERGDQLAGLVGAAQAVGELDPNFSARAAVRLTLMIAIGSVVVGALDLPPIDHDEWTALITRLVDSARTTPQRGRKK